MSYTAADARKQLLDSVATAATGLARAIALLSEAYEHLDERSADQLETDVFRPVQRAYGRAQRTHAEFAARHHLPAAQFETAPQAAPSHSVRELVEGAAQEVAQADLVLSTLQDSMLPVEVGDTELRAGLEDVRRLIAGVGASARALVRTVGR